MTEMRSVRLPLTIRTSHPSPAIGKRSSAAWRDAWRAWNAAKGEAHVAIREALIRREEWRDGMVPHTALVCDIAWLYSSERHRPDPDNVIVRTAPHRDAAQDIGLVDDDAHIHIGRVTYIRVKKDATGVCVTFRRPEQGERVGL